MGLSRAIVTVVQTFVGMFKVVDIHETKEISVENIKNIDLLATSPSVCVLPADSDTMLVELKGRASKNLKEGWEIHDQLKNQSLHVSVNRARSGAFMFFSMINLKLYVHIPRRLFDSIKVKTSSGSIKIEEIAANAIYLTASSGSVTANSCTSGTIYSIETTSGSIRSQDNQAEEFHIRANSGSIKLDHLSADRLSAKASSGSITADNITGDVTMNTSSGSIRCHDIDITGDWKLRSSSGSIGINGVKTDSLSLRFQGSSGSGHVHIDDFIFKEKSSHRIIGSVGRGEYNMDVKTSSGSFKISE